MVGDVHLSDRPPATRQASYTRDVLDKLVDVGMLADEREASAIVFVGDIFHSKVPKHTSFGLVGALGDVFDDYPAPIFIVPGNHDYRDRDIWSLESHPLGVVGQFPGVTLFGTPGRRSVRAPGGTLLFGVREEEGLKALTYEPAGRGSEPVVMVAHSAIFPPGQGPHWDHFDAGDIARRLRHGRVVDTVYYGHIHEPHGAYWCFDLGGPSPVAVTDYELADPGSPLFVNYGAISRGSIHEEGAMDRTPEVGLLCVRDRGQPDEVRPLVLPSARPADQVFRVAEVRRRKERDQLSDQFFDELGSVSVGRFSPEALIAALRSGQVSSDIPQEVVEVAVGLVEAQL